jgi:hypothetical protein
MEKRKRGRPRRQPKPIGQPLPCFQCGAEGTYYTDQFGVIDGQWRCDACHQQACRQSVRNDFHLRYGDR